MARKYNEAAAEEKAQSEQEEQNLKPLETKIDDDDGDETEVPAWMREEEDDGTSSEGDEGDNGTVPLSALIKAKQKLKGKIAGKDEELEALRQEIQQLKQSQQSTVPLEAPKRPRLKDFDDDDEYEAAMDKYEEEKLNYATKYVVKNTQQTQQLETQQQNQAAAVEAHYDRAATLVAENSISPEVFQKADTTVREIIESVMPKRGEAVFDHLVSMVGEGSEKTFFYLGRNKQAQTEFHSLLAKDKTGLQAALYLGRITERLGGSKSTTSRAPAPAAQLRGDVATTLKGSAEQKKWAAAHKKGDAQTAYELKKAARKAGIDTRTWK